jgi:maltose alpha-D-glucosyltransferase / alpha-amylase
MNLYRGWNAHSSSTESKKVKKIASATDPLWYKDAVIYELHVRAYSDSNGDGIGDFPGLLTKLDYLQDVGVTCIWLLPFFPSPMRDDGYDISNYIDVNPSYGTLDDFKAFLGAAHQRNMQVMIELVVNHTSDQHPWFKAARLAPPGSPQREMYVWSDNDQRYKDARIIFTDTEKSNWTWDETAKAYYWHRFFAHQPDLNYDNPLVIDEVLKAMRFWLDMGVDGLRIDAIPYLCEREGTSCENLPATHEVVRLLRAAIDADYANRLILAEANQWPADVRPYFGDGDECHMAFHFPLMPRIYMALRQEDRLPITDIMAQTPPIPDTCQWGLFLRNHDELTLEMVTDDERDYMYFAYSADPRMRINVGIRRRLATLVDNNRRRIELLNSLLLSFPGTPILYYGDEIGMGDNIYLGDRNGVRTPMQWTSDRNAGFSKCDPARLYLPVVMDPIYGYQAINVEAQLSDQSSLLQWTRNMIALRKLFQVFGRGTLTFLNPTNRKILAYLRELDQGDGFRETVLCVANLSRFAQSVTLDLSNYANFEAVEMIGYVSFPRITKDPYLLTLAPYSFLWLELQQPLIASEVLPEQHGVAEEALGAEREPAPLALVTSWAEFLRDAEAEILGPALIDWLPRQRWFGAKTRTIESIRVRNWAELEPGGANEPASFVAASASNAKPIPPALFFVEVTYFNAAPDTYQMPLAISTGAEMDKVAMNRPQSVITRLTTGTGEAILHDAVAREDFHQELLRLIASNATIALSTSGKIVPGSTKVPGESTFAQEIGAPPEVPALVGGSAIVSPVPLSAQPGEAAQPPRTDTTNIQSAGAQRLHPGESPSAGDQFPEGDRLDARASITFSAELTMQRLPSRLMLAEQSNTSIVYGDRLILKIYRGLQEGENPDVEIGQFLSDVAHFQKIPPFYGEISTRSATSEKTTVAMLQGLVANEGDGWQWFLDQLSNWFKSIADRPAPEDSLTPNWLSERKPIPEALNAARESLEAAELLGKRTAEMHLALSGHANLPAFAPEPITRADLTNEAERIEAQIKSALEALKQKIPALDETTSDIAGLLLSRRPNLLARARSLAALVAGGQRIRVHGDYHLGQTLRTGVSGGDEEATPMPSSGDFVILDFEGEPARSLAERRRKQSPLKDVAGMMRSFSYVSFTALDRLAAARDKEDKNVQAADRNDAAGWARLWKNSASAMFLCAYRDTIAAAPALLAPPKESQDLLNAYLLEKALYELLYELNNRPTWLHIPINGILTL